MELPYLIALHSINGMGCQRLRSILEHYNWQAQLAWEDYRNWREIKFLPKGSAEALISARMAIDMDSQYEIFLAFGASVITLNDEFYPSLLKKIYDPPVLLFYLGELPKEDDICIAIVGSRRATVYGKQVAEVFSRDLAQENIWITSGMARGIDSVCHKAAIEAGGKTLAVLGAGLDIIYPPENKNLYQEIRENGAVISEMPLGTAPLARNFPMRNRIISGLSRGVMVIEAGDKSGTLLTVDRALEQGRDIFAVPGPVTSALSRGTNNLIKQGAKPVTTAKDVWEEYYPESRRNNVKAVKKIANNNDPLEEKLTELLKEPLHFDELIGKVQLTPDKLAAALTMYEIRGIIKQLPGKYYVKEIHNL